MSLSQDCGAQVLVRFKGDDARDGSSREGSTQTYGKECNAPSRTVLFVDDEPSLLEVRRLIFEFVGYTVLTAESGEEALEVLRSNVVDAVVVDYEMPGMDGEETARQIRRMRRKLPIILSSGCVSLPQRVLETVNVSVHKTALPQVLFDTLEQQFQPIPTANGVHEIAMQLGRYVPA